MRKTKTPEERFDAMIVKTRKCWIWTGATSSSGYGVFQRGRRGQGLIRAHRFSYETNVGPVADSLFVLHRCNNKICVRPEHLYVGTHSDNLRDAWADGLRRNQTSRLTRELVSKFMSERKGRYGEVSDFARLHGVTPGAVTNFMRRIKDGYSL